MEDQVRNAADEKQVKKASEKDKRKSERESADFKWVLSTRQGRRVVLKYLEECGVFKLSAEHSGSWTYFNEGKRNIGLKLMADITASDPEAYLLMLKEKELENV